MRAEDFEEIRRVYFLSNKSQKAKAILFDRIFIWWIRNLVVLLLVDWNLSSPCYMHSTKPVLHHPSSYHETVSLFCLCLSATVSGLVWVYFNIWRYSFGSLLVLNCWIIVPSLLYKCLFVILSISFQSLIIIWVLHLSKVNVLSAVSSLTKVILIKVYTVCCITLCPVSSSPADN